MKHNSQRKGFFWGLVLAALTLSAGNTWATGEHPEDSGPKKKIKSNEQSERQSPEHQLEADLPEFGSAHGIDHFSRQYAAEQPEEQLSGPFQRYQDADCRLKGDLVQVSEKETPTPSKFWKELVAEWVMKQSSQGKDESLPLSLRREIIKEQAKEWKRNFGVRNETAEMMLDLHRTLSDSEVEACNSRKRPFFKERQACYALISGRNFVNPSYDLTSDIKEVAKFSCPEVRDFFFKVSQIPGVHDPIYYPNREDDHSKRGHSALCGQVLSAQTTLPKSFPLPLTEKEWESKRRRSV